MKTKSQNHWEFLKKETEFFFESTDFDFILNRIEEKLMLGHENEDIYQVGFYVLNRPLNKMLKDVRKLARLFIKVDTNSKEEFLILFSKLIKEKELKYKGGVESHKIIGVEAVKYRIIIDVIVNFLTEIESVITRNPNYDFDYDYVMNELKEKLVKCFTHY